VRQGAKLIIIPVDDIIYLESSENYVKIKTQNGSFLKEKTMKYFEEHLPKNDFVRLHRSYIVKLTQILSIEPYTRDSYMATLKNNEKIKVSQDGYKNFRAKLA
jgi:two-component system LytT family response regulator